MGRASLLETGWRGPICLFGAGPLFEASWSKNEGRRIVTNGDRVPLLNIGCISSRQNGNFPVVAILWWEHLWSWGGGCIMMLTSDGVGVVGWKRALRVHHVAKAHKDQMHEASQCCAGKTHLEPGPSRA